MTFQDVMHNVSMICHMHENVMNLGNEDAEEIWFLDYPDGADAEDILEMAKDPQIMERLKDSHTRIMSMFA